MFSNMKITASYVFYLLKLLYLNNRFGKYEITYFTKGFAF